MSQRTLDGVLLALAGVATVCVAVLAWGAA